MTKIFNLPVDLIEEIISRVPNKFTKAVRLTCKKWDTISKSQSFKKMHISKVAATAREGELLTIISMDYNLYLKSIVFKGIDVNPSIKSIGKLTCLHDSKQIKISRVFYCEGLLLCILKDILKLVVWNPYLGQTRWIKPRYFNQLYEDMDTDTNTYMYGLGYANKKNKSCRNHKILRFMDDPTESFSSNEFFWYEIYDFDSGLWTTLDVTPHWKIPFDHGVSLKGNTYFCATKRESIDLSEDHIICFDFTSERFGPLLPLPFSTEDGDYVTLSCLKEEKLAVLLTHDEINPFSVDIWITTKIEDEKVWWSKFLTLNTKPNYPLSSKTFFIDEGKKVIMGFDENGGYNRHILSIVGENKYLKQLKLGVRADIGSRFNTNMWPYVPSLVEIKQNGGGKRKRQSSSEKASI